MKITGAFIDDPTLRGVLDFPELCVSVDEMPDVTIEPVQFPGGWTVGKYGPFVHYECSEIEDTDAGDFNVRFRNRFPMVVDITLVVAGRDRYTHLSLPLTRARQLVRKHCPEWRLLISEHAAEKGSIMWLPVQQHPTCRAIVSFVPRRLCGAQPTRFVRSREVDLALCETHIKEHNTEQAAKRTAARAS